LKLYLQTLTRQSVSDDERASFHETMLDDVERLDQLINHLLDAARLERGGRMASAEEIRLDKLLTDCAESVRQRYQFPEERLQLVLRPCIVEAPREDLVIIFRNLLDNALKYAGDEPQVQLVLTSDEQGAPLVQVTDNGRGIPANRRRSIFGRFVRLGRELERDRPGTGLGLYIVRSLVKQLKGQIRVRDGPAGVGTTFEVALPGTWVRTYLEPEPASDVSKLTA
jgi:two-component system, OmpR family, phosphate regulon sensor histidine kinase PhoR